MRFVHFHHLQLLQNTETTLKQAADRIECLSVALHTYEGMAARRNRVMRCRTAQGGGLGTEIAGAAEDTDWF